MSATDLSALHLPEWVVSLLPERETVEEQAIRIRQEWWEKAVASRRLPGSPPTATTLTRADVWAPAEHVFTLLWRTLAWGSGSHLRQNSQRLNSIEADVVRAEDLLTRAAEESRRDPERAYALLRPRHNEIRGLGPSFFTKFLYFAGGGAPEHPCLILDRVVATALREKCGWESLHRAGPWPPETYRRYCDLLARWAREHHCAADELELTLWRS
ncbi:hypothetical protein [Amycolatopsis sp. lyj-112]|uniref:8-oxoguanine DNA glycosylase OGG fold protein n=1 Tax=Amycolatopsis sp. lyj-112 TaxID=2789288 RepID=UPI00397B768F